MKLNDIKSYCIHLKKRKDREANMFKELNSFAPNCEIFNAISSMKGSIGASKSFRAVIKKAKIQNLEQVLVFEDDVKFTSSKSKDKFQMAINSLPDDWDILLGGIYSLPNDKDMAKDPINDHLRKITDFAALHCVLFRDTAYDKVLRHNPEKGVGESNIDRHLGSFGKSGDLNIYLCWPMVAIQYNGYSDNVKNNTNYDRLLNRFDILTD